jgi:hypothetical protein
MKKIMMLMMLTGVAHADSGWDNYRFNSGEYFDRFFNQPRVLYYAPDRSAHEATLKVMARYGVRYRNQYTEEWNLLR